MIQLQLLVNVRAYRPLAWTFPVIMVERVGLKSHSYVSMLFAVGHKSYGVRIYHIKDAQEADV